MGLVSPEEVRPPSKIHLNNEHSEQARAPHTNGPRDVPRCGALSFSSNDAALQGGMIVVLMPLFAAALVVRRRYFIFAPRPFPAAPLVVHRRCFIVVYMPFPAAPLVVRCMYMAVVPGPMPAAVASRCCRRRSQQLICACGF